MSHVCLLLIKLTIILNISLGVKNSFTDQCYGVLHFSHRKSPSKSTTTISNRKNSEYWETLHNYRNFPKYGTVYFTIEPMRPKAEVQWQTVKTLIRQSDQGFHCLCRPICHMRGYKWLE